VLVSDHLAANISHLVYYAQMAAHDTFASIGPKRRSYSSRTTK
jgi:hypothetical protein